MEDDKKKKLEAKEKKALAIAEGKEVVDEEAPKDPKKA